MLNDIRVGLRLLWKARAFSITAALTLAVCIGANTALFSVVDHVLLRPLPFADSDRIVLMGNHYPGAGVDIGGSSSAPDYYDRLRETTVFSEQTMYSGGSASIDQNGTPTRIRLMNVTPSFFRLLGIAPQLGRIFNDSEGEIGSEMKVILGYGLWRSAFGGDPQVVGRDIRLDGQPFTVVGVMPASFTFVNDDILLWRALVHGAAQAAAAQQQLAQHRPAEARCDRSAGAGSDQRAECRQPRSVPAVQADSDQRPVPHDRRAAAGRSCS